MFNDKITINYKGNTIFKTKKFWGPSGAKTSSRSGVCGIRASHS